MKPGQLSEEEILKILQEDKRRDQTSTAICHKYGMSRTTLFRWRKKYGSKINSEPWSLREEIVQLERRLAEQELEMDALRTALAKCEEDSDESWFFSV